MKTLYPIQERGFLYPEPLDIDKLEVKSERSICSSQDSRQSWCYCFSFRDFLFLCGGILGAKLLLVK